MTSDIASRPQMPVASFSNGPLMARRYPRRHDDNPGSSSAPNCGAERCRPASAPSLRRIGLMV